MAEGNNKNGGKDDAGIVAAAKGLGATEIQPTEKGVSADDINNWAALVPSASDEQLREVSSYEDALALAEEINGAVLDIAKEIGTGFAILEDKAKLIGVECVAILWRFSAGDYGGFVSMAVVTKNGDKYIVNDGSSGIMEQLREFSAMKRTFGGLKIPRGLRNSEYPTCINCGKPRTADEAECSTCGDATDKRGRGETFYLDTAPASS